MFCPNCGAGNQLGLACSKCSTPLVVVPDVVPRTSGMAIAGFVLAFFCGLLGAIVSWLALSEIKKSNGALTGEGLAVAGLVLSLVSMLIGLVMVGGR